MKLKRGYVLKDSSLTAFLTKCGLLFLSQDIEQYFICKDFGCLNISGEFFKFNKNTTTKIDYPEYQNILKDSHFSLIKRRVSFFIDENLYHIDEFSGELLGLNMLEVEFKDEMVGLYFSLPEFLSSFVVNEVSNQREFSPFLLSVFGYFNESDFSLVRTMSRTLASGVAPYAPKGLSSLKASLVVLFSMILPLRKLSFLNLNGCYFALLDSARLLKAFAGTAFDERIALVFSDTLERLADPLANLIHTKGLLKYTNKQSKKKIKTKDAKKSKSRQLFILLKKALAAQLIMLEELNVAESLREYELFLSDEAGFYAGRLGLKSSSFVSARSFKACIIGLIRVLKRLDERAPNSLFFMAANYASSAELLFRYFSHQWISVKSDELMALLKILEKLRQNQAYIGLFTRSAYQPKKIRTKLLSRSQRLRTKILANKEATLSELKNINESFKIYKRS